MSGFYFGIAMFCALAAGITTTTGFGIYAGAPVGFGLLVILCAVEGATQALTKK